MDEAQFGFRAEPFGPAARGTAVFVGPKHAVAINRIQKALQPNDGVVVVTGPAGVGKTTIVNRALETLSPGRMAGWIGRIKITPDEILELLLAGFGFQSKTQSTLRRFAAFRRYLHERAAAGVPVAIVVEDACKLGVAVLAEIEALTAADTADGAGANLILMGEPGLTKLLGDPELSRLAQRIRCRERLEALDEREIGGYLKHSIREVGGDADGLLGDGVAALVAASTAGIPRLINTLCSGALAAAADDGLDTLSAEQVHGVAVQALGFDGPLPVAAASGADSPAVVTEAAAALADKRGEDRPPAVDAPRRPAANAVATDAPEYADGEEIALANAAENPTDWSLTEPDSDALPPSARGLVVESGRYPEDSIEAAAPTRLPPSVADEEVPSLIRDTQPGLDVSAGAKAAHFPVGDAAKPADNGFDTTKPASRVAEEAAPVPAESADAAAAHVEDSDEDDQIPELIMDTQPGVDIGAAVAAAGGAGALAGAGHAESSVADENFDLAAVLDPEPESTNLMPGLTENLDRMSVGQEEDTNLMPAVTVELDNVARADRSADKASHAEPPARPDDGAGHKSAPELPTLSDSMRVEVPASEPPRATAGDAGDDVPVFAEATGDTAAEPVLVMADDPGSSGQKPAPAASPGPADGVRSLREADDDTAAEPALVIADAPGGQDSEPARVMDGGYGGEASAVDDIAADAAPDAAESGEAPLPELQIDEDFEASLRDVVAEAEKELAAESPGEAARSPSTSPSDNAPVMPEPTEDTAGRSLGTDIDALEAALSAAKRGEFASGPAAPRQDAADPAPVDDDLPEIRLDDVIEKQQTQTAELEAFRAAIGSADSLEDISDMMAETLFGDEFAAIAEDAVAAGAIPDSASSVEPDTAAAPEPGEPEPGSTSSAAALRESDGELRQSVALRIDALNEIKGNGLPSGIDPENVESIEMGEATGTRRGPQPEPIERQINTSMTQTLEAINMPKVADQVAGEKVRKRGLFSRFRRSS